MAKVTIRVRFRWWVRPYTALALTFVWTMRPFVNDEMVSAFAGNIGRQIADHGMIVDCN